jgi:DNA-binding CsgD family transcriptional regulator
MVMIMTSPNPDPVEMSRLISLAYEAPFQPSGWREFTNAAAGLLHTRLAMIHHMDFVGQAQAFHVAGGIDESFSQAFRPRWSDDGDDIYLRAMRDQPAGAVRLSAEIVAPDVAEQTEIHRQLAAPWQLDHFLFASLGSRNGVTSVLSLGRGRDDDPFTTADIDLLTGALLPHLCRSISVHTSIDSIHRDNALLTAMTNMAPCGIVAFTASGRALLINETATAIFARDNGLGLRNGRLRTTDSRAQVLLDAALLNAVAINQNQPTPTPPAPVPIPGDGKAQLYQLVFSPLIPHGGSTDLPQQAACIALIHDLRRNRRPDLATTLITAYGLSKAEGRVCESLLAGKTTQEAAAALNVSPNTVKTHLARIYEKTGVHSQTALLHLLTQQSRTWNGEFC